MTISDDLQDSLEERISRKLAPAMRDARRKIEGIFKDAQLNEQALDALPLDVYDDITTAMQGILQEQLSNAYIEAANEFADSIRYPVPQHLLDEAARGWAETYAYNLAQQLNRTSQGQLSGVITDFFSGSITNRELTEKLTRIYGPRRANTIAVTEVTRAAAEGQAWVARQLGVEGVNMIAIWQTRQDEIVCPVCGPRHEQVQGSNWILLPPAHVNCRCGVRYQMLDKPE